MKHLEGTGIIYTVSAIQGQPFTFLVTTNQEEPGTPRFSFLVAVHDVASETLPIGMLVGRYPSRVHSGIISSSDGSILSLPKLRNRLLVRNEQKRMLKI